MSQYKSGEYLYGFDPVVPEYFLMKEENDDVTPIVGEFTRIRGTKGNLMRELKKRNITIPDSHMNLLALDLPF